jgi:hypothetical protein
MAEPESKTTKTIAIVGAVTGILGTIISAFALYLTWTQAEVSTAKITSPDAMRNPADCSFQTGVEGFRLSGTTKLLHGDVLWVLFSGSNSPMYMMSGEPVARSTGHWSKDLSDVGSTEDKQGALYTLWVVSANPSGSQKMLDAYEHSEGKLSELPPGVALMTTGCAQRK